MRSPTGGLIAAQTTAHFHPALKLFVVQDGIDLLMHDFGLLTHFTAQGFLVILTNVAQGTSTLGHDLEEWIDLLRSQLQLGNQTCTKPLIISLTVTFLALPCCVPCRSRSCHSP